MCEVVCDCLKYSTRAMWANELEKLYWLNEPKVSVKLKFNIGAKRVKQGLCDYGIDGSMREPVLNSVFELSMYVLLNYFSNCLCIIF